MQRLLSIMNTKRPRAQQVQLKDARRFAVAGSASISLAIAGLVVSLLVTGVSAWCAFEYASSRDPFAHLAPAFATTREAKDAATSAADSDRNDQSSASSSSDQDKAGKAQDARRSAASASTSSESPDASSQDSAQSAGASPSGSGVSSASSSSAAEPVVAPHDEQEAHESTNTTYADDSAQEVASSTISITVTIDASQVGSSAYTSYVELPAGSTAYDALLASGAAVNARATSFGTYVAAIDGIAEREHGGMSGWVYAVDGYEPNTSAANYVLTDGSTLTWTYVNAEW